MICAEIERCAEIDVGKERLAVCIMVGSLAGEPRVEFREFGTIVADLEQLRQWLQSERITHVVMESTGSYLETRIHSARRQRQGVVGQFPGRSRIGKAIRRTTRTVGGWRICCDTP